MFVVSFAYNGQAYCGYAKQNHSPSIQEDLERALSIYFRRPIETTCAGRTDTGVHAFAQHASFALMDSDQMDTREPYKIKRALDALLPDDIQIRQLYIAPSDFSARFSACKRVYVYRISCTQNHPLFTADYVWDLAKPLNVHAMQEASAYLIGEHDFKSFCKAVSAKDKPTSRYIESIDIYKAEEFSEPHLAIKVVGNAFLHSMVRTIVGTLVEVGLERKNPEWVHEVLLAKDRKAAGQNAPAQGLTLQNVVYPKSLLTALL